jgi:hypothetical protein
MKFTEVISSNIKEIAFENDKIYVTFHSGKTYSYDGKQEDFDHFMEASSKGSYFNRVFRAAPFEVVDLQKLEEENLITQATVQSFDTALCEEKPMTPLTEKEEEDLKRWVSTKHLIDGLDTQKLYN